jgi:hypothetical protein
MAARAIRTKLPGMDIRLGVTRCTIARGAGVGLVGMAIIALGLRVLAFQHINLIVIKIGHTVTAIMTFNAIGAVRFNMIGSVIVIGLGMAGKAIDRFCDITILVVTAFAGEGRVLIIHPMMNQAKAGEHLVVNIGKGKGSHSHITAPVFFVAILALAGRQSSVQAASFGALLGYVHVAILAASIGNAVDGRMTVRTFLFKLGVRGETTQHRIVTRHRRHRTGEQPAAFMHVNGRAKDQHTQHSHQGGNG